MAGFSSKANMDDTDRVLDEMKALLEAKAPEKPPAERARVFRPRERGALALMLVQSLREQIRGSAGLEPPEELMIKEKSAPKLSVIKPLASPPMTPAARIIRAAKVRKAPAIRKKPAALVLARRKKTKARPKPKLRAIRHVPRAVPKRAKPTRPARKAEYVAPAKPAGRKTKRAASGKMRLMMLIARSGRKRRK
jgi:hypothetical protein